jgi:hypothetical protein
VPGAGLGEVIGCVHGDAKRPFSEGKSGKIRGWYGMGMGKEREEHG